MEDLERGFKGIWIPADVWLDPELTALDKMILAEVDSLDSGEGGCYASNKYIAEFCGCSVTKVSTSISHLINCGLLYVESYDGRKRILKSSLSKIEKQPFKNCKSDFQNLKGRLSENERQTFKNCKSDFQNLKQINIDDNTNNNSRGKRFTPPTIEEVKAYCQERGNHVDPERFVDFYASKGWMVGKNKMKDWKACVRTWEKKDEDKPDMKLASHGYDYDSIEKMMLKRRKI